MARATVVHAQIQRLAGAASGGFSDVALNAAAADSDPSALAIARRYDTARAGDADLRDRRVAALVERLDARRAARGQAPAALADAETKVMRAAFVQPILTHGADPFHLRGALDQSRDLECLTQAVYYESRGESPAGQAAVAQVILNRVRHPAFPKSVCGVVFQGARTGGCQFSFACDGQPHHPMESAAWRRSEQVAAKALDGQVMAEVGDATHFHVAGISTGWGPRLLKVAQIGAHIFYRFGGHRGAPSMFHEEPQFSGPAPAQRPVFASLALTSGVAPARFIASASAVVEHAAAAVQNAAKGAVAPEAKAAIVTAPAAALVALPVAAPIAPAPVPAAQDSAIKTPSSPT